MRKKTWQQVEDACTKEHNARATPGSGNGEVQKADSRSVTTLYEAKSSERQDRQGPYMIVQAAWFRTVKDQALALGTEPAVYLGFPSMECFTYRYDPFQADPPSGTIAIARTSKIHLEEFRHGVPAFLIDKELWIKDGYIA